MRTNDPNNMDPPWWPPKLNGQQANKGDLTIFNLPTTMWIFLFACALWSLAHLYLCWNGSVTGSPRVQAYFSPVPGWEHPALIALGSLLPAMLAVAVVAGSGLYSRGTGKIILYPFCREMLLVVWVMVMLIASFLAARRNYELPTLSARPLAGGKIRRWRLAAAVSALLALVLYAGLKIWLVLGLNRADTIPTYWCSINLLSGVSPLLPQVLLIAGAYLWFWCTLRGLAHFGDDRPLLPPVDTLPMFDEGLGPSMMPMFSREVGGDPIEFAARPLPLTRLSIGRLAAVLGTTLLVFSVALQGPWVRTLGERRFGVVIFIWVCLYIAVIIADALQLWWTWSELRQLLVYLDRLPLRRTLAALEGLAWGSIWKMSGNVLEERYRVISFQLESLRHVENEIAAWKPETKSLWVCRDEVLAKAATCQRKGSDFARWYVTTIPQDKPLAARGKSQPDEDSR